MKPELTCLVADKSIEAAIDALLRKRRRSLQIRNLTYAIHVHPQRDPGCYRTGAELLRALLGDDSARHGLLVFDQAWDGNRHGTAKDTEATVRGRFADLGVAGRAEVVVIQPELEAWVWSGSPHVPAVLGWSEAEPPRGWLAARGLWAEGSLKPADPKAAMEAVLRRTRTPPSSALFRKLAEKVGLRQCQDPALKRLREILQSWFPAHPSV